jgi:hypothetical protein
LTYIRLTMPTHLPDDPHELFIPSYLHGSISLQAAAGLSRAWLNGIEV